MTSISKDLLKVIECAVSLDCHIIKEAVPLSCGHSICRQCLEFLRQKKIICKFCKVENILNSNDYAQSVGFDYLIETHLNEIFDMVLERINNSYESFENFKGAFENRLKWEVEVIKGKLNRRIESLKKELDMLKKHYNDCLDEFEKKAFE